MLFIEATARASGAEGRGLARRLCSRCRGAASPTEIQRSTLFIWTFQPRTAQQRRNRLKRSNVEPFVKTWSGAAGGSVRCAMAFIKEAMRFSKVVWLCLAASLQFGAGCRSADAQSDPVAPPMPVQPPVPREPTLLELLSAESSVDGALKVVGPHLSDSTNALDPGALNLAIWGAEHLSWEDIQSLPETKHAKVLKDPEAERGKRNCYRGTIVEIQVDRSAGEPIYLGGLMTGSGMVIRFAAVGATGELVGNSYANFCGITTGKYSYSNSGGGTTHAVFLVGIFDLPENKSKAAPG